MKKSSNKKTKTVKKVATVIGLASIIGLLVKNKDKIKEYMNNILQDNNNIEKSLIYKNQQQAQALTETQPTQPQALTETQPTQAQALTETQAQELAEKPFQIIINNYSLPKEQNLEYSQQENILPQQSVPQQENSCCIM